MSAEIISNTDGIVTVEIMSKLTYVDFLALQKTMLDIARSQGHIRVLIIGTDFQGWDKAGNWADDAYQEKNDPFIEKMAIVGDKKWEDLALMFTCQGFRPFPIEYFAADELARANDWLTV